MVSAGRIYTPSLLRDKDHIGVGILLRWGSLPPPTPALSRVWVGYSEVGVPYSALEIREFSKVE